MSNETLHLINELNYLENDPYTNQKQITYTRGRLIRQLNYDIKNSTDQNLIQQLSSRLQVELNTHQQQLNSRLSYLRNNRNNILSQVTQEVGLKANKVATNIRTIASANNNSVKAANGAAVIGNVVSTTFSVAKLPIIATLRLTSLALPMVGTLMVQPLHLLGVPFSMLIVPDHKYNGSNINNFGRHIGEALANVCNVAEQGIRRI